MGNLSQVGTIVNIARLLGASVFFSLKYLFSGKKDDKIIQFVTYLGNKSMMYVKIFQALAGSSDLFSDAVQEKVCEYSDSVPYTNDPDLLPELDRRLRQVAEESDKPELFINSLSLEPIHSGSVSLVYSGKLANGNDVVIKVVKKNGQKLMEDALREVDIALRMAEIHPKVKSLGLRRIMNENRNVLRNQFSMYTELSNLLYYSEAMAEYPDIKIPRAYPEFTRKFDDILVMDKATGMKLDSIRDEDKEHYGYLMAKQSVISVVKHGLYHGDLHMGNILFDKDSEGKHFITLIDFGIVGRLDDQDKLVLGAFYMSLGLQNYEDAVDTMLTTLSNKQKFDDLPSEARGNITSTLVQIASDACASDNGFGPHEIGAINRILHTYGLELATVFCKIELALAMGAMVSKNLETKDVKLMAQIQRVIRESMDIDLYDA